MDRTRTLEHLRQLIEPVLQQHHMELVDLELAAGRLRVFLDKEGGIGLDDCARMNRAIGDVLDAEDPFRGGYALEVSSPGLDRPLKTSRDFVRSIGRKVRITRHQGEGSHAEPLSGTIQQCRDDAVTLNVNGSTVEIALDQIAKAQLEIEF